MTVDRIAISWASLLVISETGTPRCQWRSVAGPLWRGGWWIPRGADGGQRVAAVIILERSFGRLEVR